MEQKSPLNWPAIHEAYKDHMSKNGMQKPPTPQPQGVHPAHAMVVHAMSMANQKPGEDHGSMVIRALSDHLKRISPDISSIHKPAQTGGQ